MSIIFQKKSFQGLVLTHFFTVLNDNLYKVLLVLFLLARSNRSCDAFILSLVSFLFVIPFIILAAFSGSLSDKYSKSKLILITRIAEVICTTLGFIGFYMGSALIGYITLILMASHTAVFAPAKFGILPEMVPANKLTKCNGIMTGITYLASILGTFLASFLAQILSGNFVLASVFCFCFSIIGFFLSLQIVDTGIHNPLQTINWFFFKDAIICLKRCKSISFLVSSILIGGFFLFIGAYTQIALIPFVQIELGYPPLYGGYFFLGTAIGIGLGSIFIGHVSGKNVSLGYVPLMGLGMGLGFFTLFFFSHSLLVVVLSLVFLGFCGGGFIVPLHAFVQFVSPVAYRGQNLATSSLIDFVGVLCASGTMFIIGHLLQLSPKTGFLIISFLILILSVYMLFSWKEQVVSLFKKE